MTREEAKHMRLFTQWQEETRFITWETTTDEIIEDHNVLIDKIYDDFESRVCGECKWFQTHRYYIDIHDKVGYPQTVCEKLRINYGKDFGCNKFERKDKT